MKRTVSSFVLPIEQAAAADLPLVGGKAASLGEVSRIQGVRVPPAFCVTTDAFRSVVAATPGLRGRIDGLSAYASGATNAAIRDAIEGAALPPELSQEVTQLVGAAGDSVAWAVRSSATTEDLLTASFAGQHDTYLDVIGAPAVLHNIKRCWASLFSDRAVSYRIRNGIDHRTAAMAVVVQQMLHPKASGVLFTADPVTSNRTVATVDAVFGLGEALVSGQVQPDTYRVRNGGVETRMRPGSNGERVLTDAQVLRLVELGRHIEAHLGRPQDIEWCLVDDDFQIVQSRPITTLFPIPAQTDGEYHVYVSVGHAQMMTDAMRPLGLSVWRHTALIPMHEAGGRLFVDITPRLKSPATRALTLDVFGRGDPLLRDALETVLTRDEFAAVPASDTPAAPPRGIAPVEIENDPAIVAELIEKSKASIDAVQRDIAGLEGTALLDFILADFDELKRVLADPQNAKAVMAGMGALEWLNDNLNAWLGEKGAADALMQSVPGNVTSEMGRALLDVADAIRGDPEAVAVLERAVDDRFIDELTEGPRAAIDAFLEQYGMRCVGEIDITRPRWSEHPLALVSLILANVRNFEPGVARTQFEQGLREAEQKEHAILERLRALPDGEEKATQTKRMIDRLRSFIGYREYPKYAIIRRHFVYKKALLAEADRLVRAGVLHDREDIFDLSLEELRDVIATGRADDELLAQRREAFAIQRTLTPPRVLTSEGEALNGAYRRGGVPAGALAGLGVSAGVVEGRARVVRDIGDADLAPGDILVTVSTDPSWSAAFVAIGGLVTEVGGLMTHGAVIAREYGLPAVVGVADATRLVREGQRIRVHGADGYVELLEA